MALAGDYEIQLEQDKWRQADLLVMHPLSASPILNERGSREISRRTRQRTAPG